MNAVLALCHFCEQHGPRIVFSTQGFQDQGGALDDIVDAVVREVSFANLTPHAALSVSDSTIPSAPTPTPSDLLQCQACGWHESCPGYISHDADSGSAYVSQHQPRGSQLFAMVRQACLRSLSSEVSPGRDGALIFGDNEQGYTFSFNFAVNDITARGGRRRYSLIMVMTDVMHLVSSWVFLDQHLQVLADELAARVRSLALLQLQLSVSLIRLKFVCPL